MRDKQRPRSQRGFTLIELLVVILIILLVSVVTLPTIIPAYNHRQIGESARILQAALVGARDAAIRANAPRGIRLLPDPVFNSGITTLASNRWIAIEPAPDYSEGRILTYKAIPDPVSPTLFLYDPNLPAVNPNVQLGQRGVGSRLVVIEAKLNVVNRLTGVSTVNTDYAPTSWYWNIRQGDKIRFGDSGNTYTVAGPLLIGGADNPERYINFGPPSNLSSPVTNATTPFTEFLYLLNGQDDNNNGYIDEACDGLDNDGDGVVDPGFNGIDDDGVNGVDDFQEMFWNATTADYTGQEYELESFVGAQARAGQGQTYTYSISRRPVITPGAREVALPSDVVIDLTTWNAPAAGAGGLLGSRNARPTSPERSRLPLDPYTYAVDILMNPNGSVADLGVISSASLARSPITSLPFYHFWLTERQDVQAPLWGNNGYNATTGRLVANPSFVTYPNVKLIEPKFLLPMPADTPGYTKLVPNAPVLKGERRLVTLFTRTGQIVTTEINREPIQTSTGLVGGSFDIFDINAPYYDAQIGSREAK